MPRFLSSSKAKAFSILWSRGSGTGSRRSCAPRSSARSCDGFSERRNSVCVVSPLSAQINVSRWRTRICLCSPQEAQDGFNGKWIILYPGCFTDKQNNKRSCTCALVVRYFCVSLPCLEDPAADFIGVFVSGFGVVVNSVCVL